MKKILTIIASLAILITLSVPVFASISNFNPQQNKNVKALWNGAFNDANGKKGEYSSSQNVIKPALSQYRHGVKSITKNSGHTKVLSGSTYSASKGKSLITKTGDFKFTKDASDYVYFNANGTKPKVAYTGYHIWDNLARSYVRLYIVAEVTGFSGSANQSTSWKNAG